MSEWKRLLKEHAEFREENRKLREEIAELREENKRLKGEKQHTLDIREIVF